MVRSVTAVAGAGRLRVVVDLVRIVPYELRRAGRIVYLTVGTGNAR